MERDNKGWVMLAGLGVGAGLMYLLDPRSGRRRRHLIADKAISAAAETRVAAGKTQRDVAHRAQGLVARARKLFQHELVPNDVLEARVRARLGRIVSHPHAIHVYVDGGHVTLTGPILANEADRLVHAISGVRGVQAVINDLEAHEDPTGVSALQGGIPREGDRGEFMQENWMPAARLAATVAGSALTLLGLSRRGALGAAAAGGGLALLARGLSNRPLRRLAGTRGGGHVVSVHKTIRLDAPVDRVFDTWSRYENFPLFMSGLHEVRDLGDGRSRWVVEGPAGIPVSWEAELTRYEPNERLSWTSLPGALVDNAGTVWFRPIERGGTQVEVHLSYDPPAGALGHVVALLFGTDPKSRMDEDLLRMKTFVETGQRPHDAAAPPPQAQV